jgi:fimbrial isopeptide formation D2 family protein/LPXTG-motif cell wall-anchored protein
MKHMKRIVSIVLALTMVLAMGISAFAAEETFTITINKDSTDKAAHTYGAYEIFTGKLETVDGKEVLSDVAFGSNVDSATLITELNKIDGFNIASDATASEVSRAISDKSYTFDSAGAQAIADAVAKSLKGSAKATGTIAADATSGTISGLPAGYYFVKDETDVNGEGAETRFILQVVGNSTVTEKASVPTIEKKVKEKNDTTNTTTDWQDAADYDIGDSIDYQITGTLPSTFADFDTYKTYTITDTLSKGLTAPAATDIVIKVGDADVTNKFDITVTGDAKAEQTITIALKSGEDLRAWTNPALTKDSKFVVTYSAVLNDAAVIGQGGNPNTVKLDFSNNPNYDGDGDTGTTPEDKVTVFTYKIVANKVGEDKKALAGAGFTLYKNVNGTFEQVGDEITGVTTFEFKGCDAGEYKLVETTVPQGYNKADDIVFTVEATYDTNSADPRLTTLGVTPAEANFTCTVADGKAETTIENRKGSTLPETGGIGTTIFYVVGAMLAIGAAVVLVTKKRVNG